MKHCDVAEDTADLISSTKCIQLF